MEAPQEVARLRARIEELETLLELNERIPVRYATEEVRSKRITTVINVMIAREFIGRDCLALATGAATIESATVSLTVARKWLRKTFGIEIRNRRGVGWYLTAEDKRKLRFALDREPHRAS